MPMASMALTHASPDTKDKRFSYSLESCQAATATSNLEFTMDIKQKKPSECILANMEKEVVKIRKWLSSSIDLECPQVNADK